MRERRRLPNRRPSRTFEIESQGLRFTATVSRFSDGTVAEIFLQNHKAGSMAGINAQDAAVVCSIALQYGVPVEVIRKALMRDSQGRASGPLGVALDIIGNMEKPK
jgi:ribonucleoside-diphosphate reductase alpha chain